MATGTVVLKGGVMATLMAVDQKGGGTDLVTMVLKGGVMATLMAVDQKGGATDLVTTATSMNLN